MQFYTPSNLRQVINKRVLVADMKVRTIPTTPETMRHAYKFEITDKTIIRKNVKTTRWCNDFVPRAVCVNYNMIFLPVLPNEISRAWSSADSSKDLTVLECLKKRFKKITRQRPIL